MDFTLKKYQLLLETLKSKGYVFKTFEDFVMDSGLDKTVVLRHDVDRLPKNALQMAKIEHSMNIDASYFFRIVPHVWNEAIIKEIVELGHEVAYHYEDLTITRGDYDKAIKHFEIQLGRLRKFYPSKTICMHGSPLSKWDNRKLWDKYNYRDYGIVAEPYFDINYNEVFYVTDTGRAWNKKSVIVRDKVETNINISINNMDHFIELIKQDKLPKKLIIGTHPHRWFNFGLLWLNELVTQNFKNIAKAMLVLYRK